MAQAKTTQDQTVEQHLASAAEDMAIAESGDARRAAYERAADHIIAAQKANPVLTLREIDRRLSWSDGRASKLVRWRTSEGSSPTPFMTPGHQVRSDTAVARRVARERPGDLVKAVLEGPSDTVDTIYRGLAEGRTGLRTGEHTGQDPYADPTEAERRRKEADAYADRVGQPVRDMFSKLAVILNLEQARDELKDMSSITGAAYEEILALLRGIEQEAEIKRAMAEVR